MVIEIMDPNELYQKVSSITINLTLTDILAVWGAFIATMVLIWDIVKWKTSGPRLIFDAKPNWHLYNDLKIPSDENLVMFSVTNIGDRQTTINNIGFYHYKNRLYKFIKKSDENAIVVNPGGAFNMSFPYILEPGKEWTGIANQESLKEIGNGKGIYQFLLFSVHRKKPLEKCITYK